MTAEIPRYRVLERLSIRSLGAGHLREFDVGAEISFEGKPGPALLPINASARANKLRAIVAGPGPHRPVDPVRLAKSIGYTGHDAAAAQTFTAAFIARETARQGATSSPVAVDADLGVGLDGGSSHLITASTTRGK
jgi:hypothetical protein